MQPGAIICLTGSELTRGETVDLNGSYLAANLTALGVRVLEVGLVPDDEGLMAAAVARAVGTAEIVVVGGGLGPTLDDLTVGVLGRVLGRGVIRDPGVMTHLRARARLRGISEEDLPENYWKQAEVVEGARVLPNPVGLAPGQVLHGEKGIVIVLPGVPGELRGIFGAHVVPAILSSFALVPPRILRGKILGIPESMAEARIRSLGIDLARVEYGISAKPGELLVKFLARDPGDSPRIDSVRELLEREFGDDFIPLQGGLVDPGGQPRGSEYARVVHDLVLATGATVATAESCTGGLIAKALTDNAGSSAYFLGSVVAYHDLAKESLLGVSPEVLAAHGAVSGEVCAAMALAARERFGADYGLSTTGIAGPSGGTAEKPVGLVWVGLAGAGAAGELAEGNPELTVQRCQFRGDRETVRSLAAVRALDLLRRALSRGKKPR